MRHYRKVIRVRAEDSPNVRYALGQIRLGQQPTNDILVEGVLTYDDYVKRRATWDKIRQTIGLDAVFYEGAQVLMFPPDWLDRAESVARGLGTRPRVAKAIGIDPAEGGDKTAMAAVDEFGLIELTSRKTPDTSVVTGEALAFARKHNVPAHKVVFDRGGGGKEHADRLRAGGWPVQSVGFGEKVSLDPKRGLRQIAERKDAKEEAYAFTNRRAQMYWDLRMKLDPTVNPQGWGIPEGVRGLLIDPETELRHQLAPIPMMLGNWSCYDPEGRFRMLPKNRKAPDSDEPCLVEIIGHSPDEADAVVLALYGMLAKPMRQTAGAA